MYSTIESVRGREILDSRGNPTLEVEVTLVGGETRRRRRALRRVDRRARGGRAAGRRPARYGGKGVQTAVRNVNEALAEAVVGLDAFDQIGVDRAMRELDGTREQGTARRERDPRRLARGRPSRGRGGGIAALSLSGRTERADAAGADDEHPQRRQARLRLERRHAGVHGDADRRAVIRRGTALGRRGLSRPEECAQGAGRGDDRRRRRGLRSESALQRGRASTRCSKRSPRPATSRGATW